MQTILKYLSVILVIISIVSCQFTEKINLNSDGSGSYTLNMDMSSMMKAIQDIGDSIEIEDPEVFDTLINFNDFLIEKKDSIAKLSKEEQEKLKALEDMKLHIATDEAKGIFLMDFIFDFKDLNELENLQDKISKGSSINENKNEESPISPTDVKFSFNGKKFERKVIERELTKEQKEAYKKSMEQSMSYMDEMTYALEYHFPKPIKSTTYKNARYSSDRKTLYIETNLKTLTEDPKSLSFTVILE